jgi:hypothetical protein
MVIGISSESRSPSPRNADRHRSEYAYYLTVLGKQVIALGLKLKNLYIIPELSAAPAS